jgi:hypothetical protein
MTAATYLHTLHLPPLLSMCLRYTHIFTPTYLAYLLRGSSVGEVHILKYATPPLVHLAMTNEVVMYRTRHMSLTHQVKHPLVRLPLLARVRSVFKGPVLMCVSPCARCVSCVSCGGLVGSVLRGVSYS